MNTNNLGVSNTSTRQFERMIDDAAWLTYPLHLAAGILKTFVYGFLFIVAIFLYLGIWMGTAHDQRADEIKDFASEQTVYRVDLATNAIAVHKAGYLVQKDVFAAEFNGCYGKGTQLKNPQWTDRNWLAEKSDLFQSAYMASSHNLAALTYALHEAKVGGEVASFHYACSDSKGWTTPVVIPNVPVVDVAFLHQTDESIMDSANAQYNWFTGMCLVGANCTDADFMPRNDSIYADAITPQVKKNQGAAIAALGATGTPDFWITAANANGITDKDEMFANLAAKQARQLARDLSHPVTPAEAWTRTVEFAIGGIILFFGFIGVWIARRTYKFTHSQENSVLHPMRRTASEHSTVLRVAGVGMKTGANDANR